MRKVYLILNTIFIIAIVMLLNAYAKSIETPEELSKKRKQNIKRVNKTRKKRRVEVVIPDENLVATLNNSNLFEVNRGEELVKATKNTSGPRNNSSFKLMGVCHFGKLKGAIITSSSRSKNSSGKSYFTIGEEVGDGYKLYEVAAKAVVLKNGSRKINLELTKAENKPQRPRVTPRRSSRRRSSRTRK
jgi:type II secretion system (T2SS) protein C